MIVFINNKTTKFCQNTLRLLKDLFVKEKWFVISASRCIYCMKKTKQTESSGQQHRNADVEQEVERVELWTGLFVAACCWPAVQRPTAVRGTMAQAVSHRLCPRHVASSTSPDHDRKQLATDRPPGACIYHSTSDDVKDRSRSSWRHDTIGLWQDSVTYLYLIFKSNMAAGGS